MFPPRQSWRADAWMVSCNVIWPFFVWSLDFPLYWIFELSHFLCFLCIQSLRNKNFPFPHIVDGDGTMNIKHWTYWRSINEHWRLEIDLWTERNQFKSLEQGVFSDVKFDHIFDGGSGWENKWTWSCSLYGWDRQNGSLSSPEKKAFLNFMIDDGRDGHDDDDDGDCDG